MPLPISTSLLLAGLVLSRMPGVAVHVIVYVLVGLAVLNEALRALVLRGSVGNGGGGQYSIPAQGDPIVRQRTPIVHDD